MLCSPTVITISISRKNQNTDSKDQGIFLVKKYYESRATKWCNVTSGDGNVCKSSP